MSREKCIEQKSPVPGTWPMGPVCGGKYIAAVKRAARPWSTLECGSGVCGAAVLTTCAILTIRPCSLSGRDTCFSLTPGTRPLIPSVQGGSSAGFAAALQETSYLTRLAWRRYIHPLGPNHQEYCAGGGFTWQ
jgi:hypothetical protein